MIMKYIYTFLFVFSLLFASAQTNVPGGNVQGNWTLANSPYLIQGNITVGNGQTLNIEPGVEVVFQGMYYLYVNGMMTAKGTASQPIVFHAQDTTGWYNDAQLMGGWRGIHFYYAPNNDSSQLSYCHIQDTKHGWSGNVSIAAALRTYRGLHVSYCKFFHNQSTQNQSNGIIIGCSTFAAGEVFEMEHCEVYDNYSRVAAIQMDNYMAGTSHVHHNQIHNNEGGCAFWAMWCRLLLEENEIYENIGTIDGSAVKLSVSKGSKIFRNKIHHNTCETIGAIHCSAGKLDIDANLICNNQHISGFCGATDGGGGIHLAHNDNADFDSTFYIVRNNVIANNYSSLAGGAVYVYNARAKFMNNHFINNTSAAPGCGMMRCLGAQSELDFQNNIFYGNGSTTASQEIQIFEAAYLRFSYNWIESPRYQRMTVALAVATYGDTLNNVIGTSPLLVAPTTSNLISDDATIANFDLMTTSPCINAGNSDTTGCYVTPKDFLNNARLVTRIDIGAFEHKGATEGIFDFVAQNESLHISPNPTQDKMKLILPEKEGNLTLYDMTGKEVFALITTDIAMQVNLPVLPQGIYTVIWEKNGKQVVDKLLILQK